ncbi:MAG: HEPN domain-containing protein [Thermovirgaceae bacterium]|nr:HEPN domain-containing protein [Thermovirgaceae bacterium]
MKPHKETIDKISAQWLLKADQDLKAAQTLAASEPPLLFPACFHAQQAAEKYIKALLTKLQIEFPKTHSIERLIELLHPALPDVCSEIMEAVDLTHYGVEVRYPGDIPEPEEKEAFEAIILAEQVRETITGAITRIE